MKKSTNNNVGEDVEKSEPLCTVGGTVNWCSHYGNGKQYRVSLKKLKIELSYDPDPGYLSKENENSNLKRYMYHIPMFTAALFTIA